MAMSHALRLVKPLVLTFYHRFRPEGRGLGGPRAGVSLALGILAYGVLFAFLTRVMASSLETLGGLLSLKGFSSGIPQDLALQLVTLIVMLALGLLAILDVAGSATRSLDVAEDGRDLLLLASQPVSPGAVIVSRGLAAALLDPLGFLLLGPILSAHVAAATEAGFVIALASSLPLYVLLRTWVHSLALWLILVNRALLPDHWRAESAAAFEAGGLLGGLLLATGIHQPLELIRTFREAGSLLEPVAELTSRAGLLIPAPLKWLLEGATGGGLASLAEGLAAFGALFGFMHWSAGRLPVHCLVTRSRKGGVSRPLGWLWAGAWHRFRGPVASFVLKDVVTIWRAKLMLAPALPLLIPVALFLLHRFSPMLSVLPPAVVLVPVMLILSTAITGSLMERVEGGRPPPIPMDPGRVALTKTVTALILTGATMSAVLLAAFTWERALSLLPWVLAASACLIVLLAEILATHPGAASEVFTGSGARAAALATVTAVSLSQTMGEGSTLDRVTLLALASALAWALRGRNSLLASDRGLRDLTVLYVFYLFTVKSLAIPVAFASSLGRFGSDLAAPLAGLGVSAGLLGLTLTYLKASGGQVGAALGLPARSIARRAVVPVAAGLGLVALFGYLGGGLDGMRRLAGLSAVGLTLKVVTASVLGPLAEEMFFRGLLYSVVASRTGRISAALITSVAFALSHAGRPSLTLLVLGIVCAGLRERNGSLFEPVVVHMVFNHSQILIGLLLAQTGGLL